MKKLLLLLSSIILTSCASAPFSSNNLANEGTAFSLNKKGDRIIIYKNTSINRTISDPEIFRINGNDLVLEKTITPPAGTISIVFDADDENFVLTKKTNSGFTLEKLSLSGDESPIYQSQELLLIYDTIKVNTYLLKSQKIDQEFSGKAVVIENGVPHILIELMRHSINIIKNSVLDMGSNNVYYGEKIKNPLPAPSVDQSFNVCSGGEEITCFRMKELSDGRGYNPKNLGFAEITSTMGHCNLPGPMSIPRKIKVSRNGRVIIYSAISNPANGDMSLYITNISGKNCDFLKLQTKGGK